MSRAEKIALGVLTLFLVSSFLLLLHTFRLQNTEIAPERGGTYIEGAIGEVQAMNPWFVTGNDVTRDLVSLVFSGLMKYDPVTGTVVDDLATVKVSSDNRVYNATLKKDLFWHDSTPELPHPVTADDVLFTFKTIQEQGFPNQILQQNFRGVTIEKIDANTVRFTLSKPYAFFRSNLTLGILPKSAFEGIPASKLRETLDFGFRPIGAGPYKFRSLLQTDISTEVTLERFERAAMPQYKIERVVMRVFADYATLLSDVSNLHGIRNVPRNEKGQPILPKYFTAVPYTLPQYVGLFFNLDHAIPADHNVRLGLQLGTNKQEIVDAIHETQIIDTPLLEYDTGDWRYTFDATSAQGAFFESNWNVPEKVRLQRLLEQRETNSVGPLRDVQRVALLGTGASLTLTGSIGNLKMPLTVNGIRVSTGSVLRGGEVVSLSGSWTVKLPAGNGSSGSLKLGINILRMSDGNGDLVDSAYLERFTSNVSYNRAVEEQRLINQFLASKSLPDSDKKKITVQNLFLEMGYLRLKKDGDPIHTRINERGRELKITLLTSPRPDAYPAIAEIMKKQWEALGASVTLDIPETRKDFEDKLLKRSYDVVLFGQSLFDNLDSYPYWHSSQIQEQNDPAKLRLDAFNLSQYASFEADTFLTRIRETSEGASREKALKDLNDLLKKDIPAIALYTPLHIFAHSESVGGSNVKRLSIDSDRFATFADWYTATERRFVQGKSWLSFPLWLLKLPFGG